jgi:predicted acylesterase/phospholipase RssA
MAKKKKDVKKGLIISGGGAFGAYGAGTLAAINKDYDIVAGISTGALMSPLVALKKWDILKEAYTSVTNEKIFDRKWYRPHVFTKKGKVNVLAIFFVLIGRMFGRRNSLNSLATTNNMRKLIDQFITEENYNEIKTLNKEIVVGSVNLNEKPSEVHYFSTADDHITFNDFKDWMWASANAPFVASIIEKEWWDEEDQRFYKGEWTDGGLTEIAPFDYVLQKGIKEVDIIMHRAKPIKEKELGSSEYFLQVVERGIGAMRYDIETKDGKFDEIMSTFAKENEVKIRVIWLPRKLAPNSMLFDKATMLKWYEEGFNTANDPARIDIYE